MCCAVLFSLGRTCGCISGHNTGKFLLSFLYLLPTGALSDPSLSIFFFFWVQDDDDSSFGARSYIKYACVCVCVCVYRETYMERAWVFRFASSPLLISRYGTFFFVSVC